MPVPVLFAHYGENKIRGSERCLLDLLTHLDPTRFTPVVWCNAPAMAAEVAKLGIPVQTSRFTILLHWDPPRFAVGSYLASIRDGLRLVRRHGIRLIHANSGAPAQWMVPVARQARVPLLAHLHGLYGLRERCTLLLHHVSLAVGASGAAVRGLLDDGVPPRRVRVIHNGIDISRLNSGDAKSLRRDLGIRDDEIVMTCVGALIPLKGVDILVRAAALLRRMSLPVRVVVVGEGPERPGLERLVAELGLEGVVSFLGERADVGAVFRDATDIAVIASRSEVFGLTALEAAAFRLPVVATRVGGVPEVVIDDVNGRLVPPDSPEALAAALAALVEDPVLRGRLGTAGRGLLEERFTIARNVGMFQDSYDLLLATPRRDRGWMGPWGPLAPWGRLVGGALARRLSGAHRTKA